MAIVASVGSASSATFGPAAVPSGMARHAGGPLPAAAPTTISAAAYLLAQLDALARRDRTAFERVARAVARRLRARAAARAARGEAPEAAPLESIAARFDEVAAQGSLAPLTGEGAGVPPSQRQHHHVGEARPEGDGRGGLAALLLTVADEVERATAEDALAPIP